jgi:membrane-bound serine protease (ClpP class)
LLAGLFLLSLELVVPSGMLLLTAIACAAGSVWVAWLVWWGAGLIFLAVVLGLAFFTPTVGLSLWRRSPAAKHLFLEPPPDDPANDPPSPYEQLRGEVGRTLTPLRPAGAVEIAGQRVSAVSQGVMVPAGELVRVAEVEGNRVVVRQLSERERQAFTAGAVVDIPDVAAAPPASAPPPRGEAPRQDPKVPFDFDAGLEG